MTITIIAASAIFILSACTGEKGESQSSTPAPTSQSPTISSTEAETPPSVDTTMPSNNRTGEIYLFVELPYYTTALLNLWMASDNDEILDQVYNEWEGTACYNPDVKAFYQRIKQECPETVFHGTDVGHQYNTTGERYLS